MRTDSFDNRQPIFLQIIDRILLSIAVGELAPGEKVLSVRELAQQFSVNPNTIQRSMQKLEEMGYLQSHRTTGRKVTTDADLIAALKKELPRKITQVYIQDMQKWGLNGDEILELTYSEIQKSSMKCSLFCLVTEEVLYGKDD